MPSRPLPLRAAAARLAVLFLLAGASCSSPALEPARYAEWVQDPANGLLVEQRAGSYRFQLQHTPVDYLALRALQPGLVDRAGWERERAQLAGLQYYTLRIWPPKERPQRLASRWLDYLAGPVQDDLSLLEEGRALPCLLHHLEGSLGITPYASLVLAFEQAGGPAVGRRVQDKVLVLRGAKLGVGTVRLTIKRESLQGIPQLKLGT